MSASDSQSRGRAADMTFSLLQSVLQASQQVCCCLQGAGSQVQTTSLTGTWLPRLTMRGYQGARRPLFPGLQPGLRRAPSLPLACSRYAKLSVRVWASAWLVCSVQPEFCSPYPNNSAGPTCCGTGSHSVP